MSSIPNVRLDRESRPFLDYYRGAEISPVRQDVADAEKHRQRRESLYRLLGVLPQVVRGARVLEVGPGSGHNALYTASLSPAEYTLYDGNAVGLRDAERLLRSAFPGVAFNFVEGVVEELPGSGSYDVVIAEGLIAGQRDVIGFTRTIAGEVAPGGVLIVSTCCETSFIGETLRRLVGLRTVPASLPLAERVPRLVTLFAPHLARLRGMSRLPEDWVLDNLTQPLTGVGFTIEDAIDAVSESFDFYGSSPRMLTDWRWYKQLHSGARDDNGRARSASRATVVNLLDYRYERAPHDPVVGDEIRRIARRLWEVAVDAEFGEDVRWRDALADLAGLSGLIGAIAPETAAAFDECAAVLRGDLALDAADNFAGLFGRGSQYVSFTRRDGPPV